MSVDELQVTCSQIDLSKFQQQLQAYPSLSAFQSAVLGADEHSEALFDLRSVCWKVIRQSAPETSITAHV